MNRNPLDSGVPFYQSLGQAKLIKPFFFSNSLDHSTGSAGGTIETVLLDFDTPRDYLGVITSIEVGYPNTELYQAVISTTQSQTFWDLQVGESSAFAWQETLHIGTKINQLPYYKDENILIPIAYPSTSIKVKWFDVETYNKRFMLYAFVKGYYYR